MIDKFSTDCVESIDRLYWLKKNCFSNQEIENLRLKCTVDGPLEFSTRQPGPDIHLFEETDSLIGIPRAFGIKEYGFHPRKSSLIDARVEYKFTGKLREKQKLAFDAAKTRLNSPPFSGVIALPPGSGKTVLCLAISDFFQSKTLVVVHKEFLMDQWTERILQFTDIKRHEIGRVQADKVDIYDKKIVLGMMQSLYQKEYFNVFDKFGMVIFDECHRVGAGEWSNIGKRFNAKFKLGVSATVSRGDDTDRIIEYHIGNIIYEDLKYDVIPKIYQTNFVLDFDQEDVSNRRGEVNIAKMITKISECDERNKWITGEILKARSKDRKILVLSHRLNQLKDIEKRLSSAGISCFDTGFYVGGMDIMDRRRSENCKIMLATYQMACIEENSEIFDYSSGEIHKAREIIDLNKKVSMCSMDNNGKYVISNFDVCARTGEKECVEIATTTGMVTVSKDHKLLTQDGYKEASNITTKDYLVSPDKISVNIESSGLSKDEMWSIGCIIGDGSISQIRKGVAEYVSADKDILNNLENCLCSNGMYLDKVEKRTYHYFIKCILGKHGRGNKSWLRNISERYDLIRKGKDKKLPKEFLVDTEENISSILGGLFDTDGCAFSDGRRVTCSFYTVSNVLSEQIRFLLLRLGIHSYKTFTTKKGYSPVNVINIPKVFIKRFIELIDLRLTRKKKILESVSMRNTVSKWNAIPRSMFEKPLFILKKNKQIKIFSNMCMSIGYSGTGMCFSDRDISKEVYDKACTYTGVKNECGGKIFSRVKLITDVGIKKVCDFSIPEHRNYLVNNYVIHNSEGMDVPELDCLIFATPLNKIEQPIGRTLRKIIGKRQPVIVDIVDHFDITQRFAYKRREKYDELGFDTVLASKKNKASSWIN